MTRDAREIEREGMLSDMETLRAEKRELHAEIRRLKTWEKVADSARADAENMRIEVEQLKADNHRLMMWNEELQGTMDGMQDTIAELRAALEPKP